MAAQLKPPCLLPAYLSLVDLDDLALIDAAVPACADMLLKLERPVSLILADILRASI